MAQGSRLKAQGKSVCLQPSASSLQPSGFTLIEIVLVAVVLVILLTATMPNFQQTAARLRVEQAAFHIAQQLRYAHQRAVAQGDTIVWAWDAGDHQARLYELAPVEQEPTADSPAKPSVTEITDRRVAGRSLKELDIAVALHRAQEGQTQDTFACAEEGISSMCAECACLHFHPDGTVQDGAAPPIDTVLTRPTLTYTIRIDAPTGQVFLLQSSLNV